METKPPQENVKRVMNCLTPDLIQRLDAVATRQVTSRSLLIRQACEKYLREIEPMREAA